MTSPIGYNNPAYSHQFDSTLYDYQYVSEIDPDFDGQPDREQEQIHLVHPSLRDEFSGTSEEFDASDESNQSIIVEECNNRRVTLICEKRNKTEEKVYEDKNCKGAYHHNISVESEEDYRISRQEVKDSINLRHQRRLDPPSDSTSSLSFVNPYKINSNSNHAIAQNNSLQYQLNQRPQRQHRYEKIDDYNENINNSQRVSRYRYAEITVDKNGYPSIGNEIEIEHNENGYRIVNADNQRSMMTQKQRAPSPICENFPSSFSPSKTYQRTISPRPQGTEAPPMSPLKPIPMKNTIEMTELSPPDPTAFSRTNQTIFFQSPKRQPPIGASSPAVLQDQLKTRQGKSNHKRQGSVTTSRNVTPNKPKGKPSMSQIFQAKSMPNTPQTSTPKGKSQERNSSRRNISHSFRDPPKEFSDLNFNSKQNNPYKPTTMEVSKAKTAIITPILQRKNRVYDDEFNNFRKISSTFQSTGNLCKGANITEECHKSPDITETKSRIKRNRSVPNFAQSLSNESKFRYGRGDNNYTQDLQKSTRNMDYQYSPAKSVDRFSPIDRSRISLIDQTKISWSNSGNEFQPPTSGCLVVSAIVQIATSIASCAICFYLFSKLGRRYYLDFGILAGFVNFILGVLGFRSQCWRWLPNRNYVSGYILVTAFSILTCAGFIYLITARPMSGDPVLDIMGGGICGVSVLTIVLAITGLTMSGCCKTPPPDNRVNNI